MAALYYEPQPMGYVRSQRSVPTRQTRPVSRVEETGLGIRTTGKKFETRIIGSRCRGGESGLALESELARGLDREPVPELGAGMGLALEPELAPMTSHSAQPCPPKLPGISSRFLLEMKLQVAGTVLSCEYPTR